MTKPVTSELLDAPILPSGAALARPLGPAYLRVIVETHDSRLEMDTRCGSAKYIEARAVEAIRCGCVGLMITPNTRMTDGDQRR